ncbi:hypothetical protein ACRAWF_27745 [Streptomyces sp. L7]
MSGVYRTTAATDGFWTGRETLDQPSRRPQERFRRDPCSPSAVSSASTPPTCWPAPEWAARA